MKAKQNTKSGQALSVAKSINSNQLAARARIAALVGAVSLRGAARRQSIIAAGLSRFVARGAAAGAALVAAGVVTAAEAEAGGGVVRLRPFHRDAARALGAWAPVAGVWSRLTLRRGALHPEVAEAEAARAEAAGLLSAADVAGLSRSARAEAAADVVGVALHRAAAARAAAEAAATAAARAAGNGAAIGRLHRLAAAGACGVVLADGSLQVDEKSGAAAMVEASCAAIGHGDTGARAALVAAEAAAKRAIGKGWHTAQAETARARLIALQAAEVRASAARMLRGGSQSMAAARGAAAVALRAAARAPWGEAARYWWPVSDAARADYCAWWAGVLEDQAAALRLHGRASARAARIGWAVGRTWLKRNSRREALAAAEVGAAAGVDDKQAGADWMGELQGISRAAFMRAAAYGVAIVRAPLAPCAALVARGLSGGLVDRLQWAALGRGRRVDGLPVVAWTADGRQVAADSIGTIGRGCVFMTAARIADREMHAARYGSGGRDGKEVGGDWRLQGSVSEWARVSLEIESAAAEIDAAALDGAAPEAAEIDAAGAIFGGGRRRAATRRPSVVHAARVLLAGDLRAARAAAAGARAGLELHSLVTDGTQASKDKRAALGAALGGSLRALSHAVARAAAFGAAMSGAAMSDTALADWLEDGKGEGVLVMTAAARKRAQRMRDSWALREVGGVVSVRAEVAAGTLAGDETAEAESVAGGSLLQSGTGGAALRAALAAMAAQAGAELLARRGAEGRARRGAVLRSLRVAPRRARGAWLAALA